MPQEKKKTHPQEASKGHRKRKDKEVLQPLKGGTEKHFSDLPGWQSLAGAVSVQSWTEI